MSRHIHRLTSFLRYFLSKYHNKLVGVGDALKVPPPFVFFWVMVFLTFLYSSFLTFSTISLYSSSSTSS